jgi:hypothetical protein
VLAESAVGACLSQAASEMAEMAAAMRSLFMGLGAIDIAICF